MRIGVCSPIDRVDHLENLGYDLLELSIGGISELNDEELVALKQRLADRKIKVESANCMLHGSLPQAYQDPGLEKISAYLAAVMPKLKYLGITTAVFGSGFQRRVPEDMFQEQRRQIIRDLLTVMEREARKNGITIAIEPLNKKETNMLLTTDEAMSYIKELNLPNMRLLVDLYHFYCEGESLGPDPGIRPLYQAYPHCGAHLPHLYAPGGCIRLQGLPPGAAGCGLRWRADVRGRR